MKKSNKNKIEFEVVNDDLQTSETIKTNLAVENKPTKETKQIEKEVINKKETDSKIESKKGAKSDKENTKSNGNKEKIGFFTKIYNKFLKKSQKEDEVQVNSVNIAKQLPSDIQRYNPDIATGLTATQVSERISSKLTNKDLNTNSTSIGSIFMKNIFTFFNMLEFAIFITLLIFQQYTQTIFFLIIVINTIIGIAQEIKSKKTIDKLKLVNMQSVTVLREGKELTISSDDLVLDDLYLLKNGDQIPADAIILDGQIEVNESLLTGESLPIKKAKKDSILAGSFVVSGSAIVKAVKIAQYNYANGIQSKAKEHLNSKSELTKSLNIIIKVVSFIIIPLGIALFVIQWKSFANRGLDIYHTAQLDIQKTAGSLIGMIPAGMYLLTSVALAVGAMSLAKKNTLVQDLYCIEMLARVNTLCLDKTGTLTDGTMKVADVKLLNKKFDLPLLMGSFLSSFKEANQTSLALADKFTLNNEYQPIKVLPFSSKRKLSAVTFKGDIGTYVLGAPEYVIPEYEELEAIAPYIKSMQKKGYRIVLLATTSKELQGDDLDIVGKLKPVAVFALEDHIRTEAPDTISWFVNNDVEIKIISGDDPLTASEIAKKCGVPNASKCVSLKGMSLNEVSEIVTDYTVFGRVSPEQKAFIIEKLKDNGKTVGMTGDGVNDILAMKSSDCSIAMANGSNAAKNVANLVLLDSNFASMPSIVREGRRVINNIQRSSSLFLMKTIFVILFTLICICCQIEYPFTTNNILLFEVIGIGLPSFFLALQPNNQIIRGNFIKNTLARAIPAALCLIFAMSLNYVFKYINFLDMDLSAEYTVYNTYSFTTFNALTMTVIALVMVYSCCYPFNRYRSILFISLCLCMVLFTFGMPFIPSIATTPNNYIELNKVASFNTYNFSTQFTGIDFRFLNKTMWLILTIYLFSISLLLSLLNVFFSGMDKEMKKEKKEFLNFKE